MQQARFSEQQIAILHQDEEGAAVEEVCRKAGISTQTYCRWRKKYGGLMPSEMKRLKLLEEENAEAAVVGRSSVRPLGSERRRGGRQAWWDARGEKPGDKIAAL